MTMTRAVAALAVLTITGCATYRAERRAEADLFRQWVGRPPVTDQEQRDAGLCRSVSEVWTAQDGPGVPWFAAKGVPMGPTIYWRYAGLDVPRYLGCLRERGYQVEGHAPAPALLAQSPYCSSRWDPLARRWVMACDGDPGEALRELREQQDRARQQAEEAARRLERLGEERRR